MVGSSPLALWDGRISTAANLARDEELLRSGAPAVRVAVIDGTAVSVGVAQTTSDPVHARAAAAGVEVVRRSTGGTGVLHLPGDLVWSVVLPRGHPLVGADFTCAYPRLGQGVVDALGSLRVTAEWAPPLGLSDEFCLLGPRGNALVTGPKALGGAAQHLTRGALLHQGVVAASVDRGLLATVFQVPPETLAARVTALSELATPEEVRRFGPRLLDALEATITRAADRSSGASTLP